jgi:hypothetical protein
LTLLILLDCGALRNVPVGLKDALDNADWELVKKIAGPESSEPEHPESNEEQ